ncbi:MAG: hypothetical protein ACRC46_05415 [Thermoguttaceae bacterium]
MSHNKIGRVFVVAVLLVAFIVSTSGCGLCKKYKRGMILRGDWAVEINRTPWVGCPADVGCDGKSGPCEDASCDEPSSPQKKLLSLFRRGDAKGETEKRHGFRIACGKRRGCRSQSPCRLSPICGSFFDMDKPNPVILAMMRNGQIPIPMDVPGVMDLVVGAGPASPSTMGGGMQAMSSLQPMSPMMANSGGLPVFANGGIGSNANSGILAQQILATPGTTLPPGGSLPAGGMVIAGGMVMRPCGMVPQCTAATPCRTHPQCGVLVPATMAQGNAMMLAAMPQAASLGGGLYPSLVAGGAAGAGTNMGMMNPLTGQMTGQMVQGVAGNGAPYGNPSLVNPVTGQVVQGMSIAGTPHASYPPIGYAAEGYSPGFQQQYVGNRGEEVTGAVAQQNDEKGDNPERVPMPSPRFHSVPTRPTFQRAQGMASSDAPQQENTSASASAAAIQRAYLKGMYAAIQKQQSSPQPVGTGFLNGLAAAPSNIWGFLTDNRSAAMQREQQIQFQAQQILYQQQLAAMQQQAATNATATQTATNNVAANNTAAAEDTDTTRNDEIVTVSHKEEPPAPPKKSAPMPKLIQQVSYLDVQ